ncbi:GGDEF domain-containing protein [Vibrio salinus]|uniref:GGDEF domain-containing protein n=1 Tax=Vibrio salinus TaxID=2899784 RepID=UPI001E2F1461|nr:diguanylate cyclase [Vibrio salinus]MCE0492407.1 diguanylate cyclase [Vibrio salinus]
MDKFTHSHVTSFNASIAKSIIFLLSAVSLLLSVIELFSHNLTETTVLILFAGYSGILYYLHSFSKCSSILVSSLLFFYTILVAACTYFRVTDNDFWLCITPLIMYFLAGFNKGLLYTALFFLVQTTIFSCHNITTSQLNNSYYTSLLISFLFTWISIHLYEKKRMNVEDTLMSLATRDPLTGANNRLSLAKSFGQYKEHKNHLPTLHLLILDIDHFKQVNDTYGHDIGDKVLIDLTLLIRKVVGDGNVYRIGGEEFCITIFENGFEEVLAISEKLRQTIGDHIFNFGTQRFQMTSSIGICTYRDGENLPRLLKSADIELYKAKNNGRNQICICNSANADDFFQTEQPENS